MEIRNFIIMKKYIFAKADPTFKALFKEEKKRLKKIVKSKVSIEHIGSTAVAGLGGKEQ
ncbi:MAG: hypothetical protein K940chlam5_00418 [Candidatus Anoxychlamydiales bacterium]|nr:hypothetical protein [Candidatus Anoxychlamydiales bacterium]